MTGSFEWAPKRHNLAVLVTDVFRRIRRLVPNARLSIVGKGLSGPVLRAVQAEEGVEYLGPVPDIRPHIARASVVVNYVESGGGIAIKVLEAMSMGKPVVANTLAAEGIAAVHGRDLLIASSKEEFAESVASVLGDPDLQARLGRCGRELVTDAYSSASLAIRLVDYYDTILGDRRGEPAR
jgi:glycosyltransferase involved in cell wall biosynthesis